MRFIALWLSGLIAVSSASAAQLGLRNENGPPHSLVKSVGQTITPRSTSQICPKGTKGKWPSCISTNSRKCPENTTGKWPNCQDIVRYCPEGTTGKWPKCKPKPTVS